MLSLNGGGGGEGGKKGVEQEDGWVKEKNINWERMGEKQGVGGRDCR